MPGARIELRLRELNQLFNSMDPSPFRDKDLDDEAEEFIVGWARELPSDNPLDIVVHLSTTPPAMRNADEYQRDTQEAVQHFFAHKADHERREFSELMRIGRVSLLVGLAFLAACFVASTMMKGDEPFVRLVRESLIIVGWVALWRPLEIFLYDWWPIVRHMKLYRRLSRSKVTLNAPSV